MAATSTDQHDSQAIVDWIYSRDATHGEQSYLKPFPSGGECQGFMCRRCGASEDVPLPIAIDVYLAYAKNVSRRHRLCQEPHKKVLGGTPYDTE